MYSKKKKILKNIKNYGTIISELNKEKYKPLIEKLGLSDNDLNYVVYKNKKGADMVKSCKKFLDKKKKKKKIAICFFILYKI